ncbi:hypothetical protein IWQ61_007292 [Dispira simplex]|nr:hypothetical protein IWQ61_007292 [Dispira simplex]
MSASQTPVINDGAIPSERVEQSVTLQTVEETTNPEENADKCQSSTTSVTLNEQALVRSGPRTSVLPPAFTLLALLLAPIPSLYSFNLSILHYPLDSIHYVLFQLIFVVAIPTLLNGLYTLFGASSISRPSSPRITTTTEKTTTRSRIVPITQVRSVLTVPSGNPTVPPSTLSEMPSPVSSTEKVEEVVESPISATAVTTTPSHRYAAECEIMIQELLQVIEPTKETPNLWTLVFNQSEPFPLQVYQKQGDGFCFKISAILETSAETAFDLLADATRRLEWDDMCQEVRIVEVLDPPDQQDQRVVRNPALAVSKIQYVRTKPIWPTSARDVCLLSYNRRLGSGRYISATKSTTHPDCPEYTSEGVVRMTAGIAGQLVTALPTPPGDTKDHCRVVQIADGSPGGWLPQSVVRFVATKAMPQSFKKAARLLSTFTPYTNSQLLPSTSPSSPSPEKESAPTKVESTTETSTTSPSISAKFAPYAALCDELSTQLVAMADSPLDDPAWQPIYKQSSPRLLQIYQKQGTDYCFKIVADLNNSAYSTFDLVTDITRRPTWDSLCAEARVVELLDDDMYDPPRTMIQYMRMKPVWPTSARDACVLSHCRALPDGRLLNVTKSVNHSQCSERDTDGLVRMVAGIAGQIVFPVTSSQGEQVGSNTRPTCRMVQIVDGDPRGWIPKSVTKFVATKAVPDSIQQLNNALLELPVETQSRVLPSTDDTSHPKSDERLLNSVDQGSSSHRAPSPNTLLHKIQDLEGRVDRLTKENQALQFVLNNSVPQTKTGHPYGCYGDRM